MGVLKERRHTFICAVCNEAIHCVTNRQYTALLNEHRVKHSGSDHDYGMDASVCIYYNSETDTDDALNAYLVWRTTVRDSDA